MLKMKAAVLYETGADVVIEDGIEVVDPGLGQVLVKLAYSGVCHSQLMEVRGFRGEDRYLPHLLGHEGSGLVMDIGEGVTKVKSGDHVILGWIKGGGREVENTLYRKGNRIIHAGAVTTLNEYAVVSENRCVKLPPGLPLDVAVLFGCAIPTGAGIILNEIKPEAGSSIAFFGLGGVGMSALLVAQTRYCEKIIAVDIEDEKLRLAKEFGATHCIHAGREDPVVAIRDMTNGKGVDYSVESAGMTSSIEQAFGVVKNSGGLCIFASHPKTGEKIRIEPHDLISGKQIRGTWGGACRPDRDIPIFANLYREGKLPLDRLLSHRFCIDDINKAFHSLEKRTVVRSLISFSGEEK